MTSPFTKPNPTQDKYNDIHARGGTYGSDLRNEQDVRNLLKTEIKSPFVRAMKQVGDAIEGFVGDIASAIRGDGGAKYQAINVAVTERLGPINTAITETGARHKELADKVDEKVKEQDSTLSTTRQTLNDLDSMVKALKKADEEQKAKVQSSIDTAKSATAQAAELRNELTRLSFGLNKEIESSKAVRELKEKFDGLNNEFGSRVDSAVKNSAELKRAQEVAKSATAKSTNAVAEAKKATSLLENSVDVAASAVPLIPGTTTPTWQHELVPVKKGTHPEDKKLPKGINTYYRHRPEFLKGTGSGWTSTLAGKFSNVVAVDNRVEYKISMWIRATRNDSRYTYVTLCDQSGNRYIIGRAPDTETQKGRSSNTWGNPLRTIIYKPSTKWEYVESVFTFKDGVEFVKVYDVSFQTRSEMVDPVQVFITDLRIAPLVPSQAEVDAAQNKAIEANTKAIAAGAKATEATRGIATNAAQTALANTRALQAQEKINQEAAKWKVETEDWKAKKDQFEKTTKDFLATQAKVEQLQTKTDTAQNDALTALNKPEMNGSLVPMVPNNGLYKKLGKYEWIPEYTTFGNASTGAGSPILQATGRENTAVKGSAVDAEPGGTYRVEFTAYAGSSGSSIYIELRNAKNLDPAVESSTGFTIQGDSSGKVYGVNGGYLVGDVRLKKGTHTYVGYITLKKDVEQVRLYTIYWNHPNGSSTGTQMLYSLKVYQPVPSQAEIDEMQNKALEQSAKFDEAQVQINRLVQEQLWNHQDTMEMLDIRSPKTYGYETGSSQWQKVNNPYDYTYYTGGDNRGTKEPKDGMKDSNTSPFVTVFTEVYKSRKCWITCKGQWQGSFEISINWTNGAVDVWNIDVMKTGVRVFEFRGGNSTIEIRNISVTVIPTCLNREMKIFLSPLDSIGDVGSISGDTSLIRAVSDTTEFRASAPVRCNQPLNAMNEKGEWEYVSPRTVISGRLIRLRNITATHTFTEYWDFQDRWDKPSGNDWNTHNWNTTTAKFIAK